MKWNKETQAYMWAHYYSEDGTWKAWDDEREIKGASRKKFYNPKTKQMENMSVIKHFWKLMNLKTGEIVDREFKTLREAKEFAER